MKAKRLVALLAAVMLIVGVLALPASAAMKCKYCPSLNVSQDAYSTVYYSKKGVAFLTLRISFLK